MINTGSEGPDLVDFLEVPEIIQEVLQYVRESRLAIFGMIRHPPKPQTYLNKKQQFKRTNNN